MMTKMIIMNLHITIKIINKHNPTQPIIRPNNKIKKVIQTMTPKIKMEFLEIKLALRIKKQTSLI